MSLEQATNELVKAALMLLSVLAVYGVKQMINYLNVKMGEAEANKALSLVGYIKEQVKSMVRFLEMTGYLQKLDGAAKFEKAMAWLQQFFADKGIEIDAVELRHYIEEAVQEMNNEIKDESWYGLLQGNAETKVEKG
jgi:hypothetical protein